MRSGRSSRAGVAVMQAADLGDDHDGTKRRRLNAPRNRSVPLQGEMWTRDVVVLDVITQDAPQVPFAEDDQVVQALPAYRSDDSLGVGILPGRLWGGEDLPDTDRPDDPPEFVAVGTIPIAQQVARLGAISGEDLSLLKSPSALPSLGLDGFGTVVTHHRLHKSGPADLRLPTPTLG